MQIAIDLDELGAVAQRLKNEIAAGSWVSRPQKGLIDFSTGSAPGVTQAARGRAPEQPLTFEAVRKKYLKNDENKDSYKLSDSSQPVFSKLAKLSNVLFNSGCPRS